ncbi:MAG: hypothetical protein ACK5HZ_04650 [Macellibacteroides fermentans]|uniref:hypothetical protein n=1 Tax=Macellibacteroides fermentans TaxID=879969 RepID=UPI003ABFA7B7
MLKTNSTYYASLGYIINTSLKLKKLGFTISGDGTNIDPDKFNVPGLGDYSEIRAIWLKHMKDAIEKETSWKEHLGE